MKVKIKNPNDPDKKDTSRSISSNTILDSWKSVSSKSCSLQEATMVMIQEEIRPSFLWKRRLIRETTLFIWRKRHSFLFPWENASSMTTLQGNNTFISKEYLSK